jgi:hypothetical protein
MSNLKSLIKILSLLIILVPCVGRAENWKSMGSTSVAKFYHDADQLVGEQENRKLVVKVNYAEETKDGTRSALQEIFVNCIDRTYSIGIVKRYSLSDLQGSEKTIAATGRKQSPVQGSLGADYIKRACESAPKNSGVNTNLYQADATSKTQISGNAPMFTDVTANDIRRAIKEAQITQPSTAVSGGGSTTNTLQATQATQLQRPVIEEATICPPPKQEQHGSVEAAIAASKSRPATCVRGNQTVSSNISVALNGQTNSRYEIYKIEGTSPQTQRLLIQIFSDGEASVISNGGGRMGYMHQGNGVFQSGSDVIKVDEKSRIVNVNGINVVNVNIEKKDPPNQVNLTYGQKLNFPKPLDSAKDQIELKAACVSSAQLFVSQSAGTAFNTKGAIQWAACTTKNMAGTPNFISHVGNWNKRLVNERVDAYILGIYFERCSRAFPAMINLSNGKCL